MAAESETRIAELLTNPGGPPERAPQLCAIAAEVGLSEQLPYWIEFHKGSEWSAQEFRRWCVKFMETQNGIKIMQDWSRI